MTRYLFGALCLTGAHAASAETLKAVPTQLKPDKAYVLVEYKLQPNPMANFPGSRKFMPLTTGLILARFDGENGDVRGFGKATASKLPGKASPIEPFHNREIVRGETSRLHLIEVDPDLWVVQGFGNTSFALGSYSFRLEPGTVTDLGVATAEPDWAEGDRAANAGDLMKMAFLGPFAKRPDIAPMRVTFRPRTAQDIALPGALPPGSVKPVSFAPGVTFGNYLGGLVNRIEGVNATLKAKASQPQQTP